MFEYLMPLLIMPTCAGSLLDQTYKAAVAAQQEYGALRGAVGISESGYNTVDAYANYQYRAFGVPDLGLKRGLGDDLVVAPYASMMALMVAPEAACANLQRLAADGLLGRFGFYEAVDYTPARAAARRGAGDRLPAHGAPPGMSLLALPTCCAAGRCRRASSPTCSSRPPCRCSKSASPRPWCCPRTPSSCPRCARRG